MGSEQFDNTDLTASNISEISCGGSLCLSTKEQYKVINRNQLTKLDFQLFRTGTTSIECGMSLMEEISDLEDDYENPFESASKRERLRKFVENVKYKSKKGCSDLKRSISSLGRKIAASLRLTGAAKEADESSDNNKRSVSRLTSSCGSAVKRSKTASLSFSKLKSISKCRMAPSTSRRARMRRKVSRVSDRATYKLKTNLSYISKRLVSASSTIKSKMVYNCYKLRSIVGDKFPRRNSMFVLSFRKGSEEAERRTTNCGHCHPSNELMHDFEHELIYDSVEYISRNEEDGGVHSDSIEVQMMPRNTECGLNIGEFEPDDVLVTATAVGAQSYEAEKEVAVCDKSSVGDEGISSSGDRNQAEVNLAKDEILWLESSNGWSDEATPTTTINSFLRLSSVGSTTCCTIQNDTNSNTPFPVAQSVGKVMEQMESLYQELIQLKGGECGEEEDFNSEEKEDKDNNKSSQSTRSSFLPLEKEDMEIFSSMKEIVSSLLEREDEMGHHGGGEVDASAATVCKQGAQLRNDMVFTLSRQIIQYYESIKNSHFDFELKKVKSNDNEQMRHLIIGAIQKLKSSGNARTCEV